MNSARYTVALKRSLAAGHFLPDSAKEAERTVHRHEYGVTVQFEGDILDRYGYLLDIDDIDRHLAAVLSLCSRQVLNDVDGLKGVPPSIEHLARFLCGALRERIRAANIRAITVIIAENTDASASYREEFVCGQD